MRMPSPLGFGLAPTTQTVEIAPPFLKHNSPTSLFYHVEEYIISN